MQPIDREKRLAGKSYLRDLGLPPAEWLARKYERGSCGEAGRGHSGSSPSHLRAQHNSVAERVEAADQALGRAMLVDAIEVVGAEVDEGNGALQHVEHRREDLVRDGHGGLLGAHARLQPMEFVAQVGAL